MAHLIRKIKVIEREINGRKSASTRPFTICSNCGNQIYTPTELVGCYNYCYHCGAKFDIPVDAEVIKQVLQETKEEVKN